MKDRVFLVLVVFVVILVFIVMFLWGVNLNKKSSITKQNLIMVDYYNSQFTNSDYPFFSGFTNVKGIVIDDTIQLLLQIETAIRKIENLPNIDTQRIEKFNGLSLNDKLGLIIKTITYFSNDFDFYTTSKNQSTSSLIFLLTIKNGLKIELIFSKTESYAGVSDIVGLEDLFAYIFYSYN